MTCNCLMQGEERDSSDEEWGNAYAAMDPASQLGWRHRRCAVEGPAEELMRDIMQTADVVHSAAMSDMVGSTNNDNGSPLAADESTAGSMSMHRDGSWSSDASVEIDRQGACSRHRLQCVLHLCLYGHQRPAILH